MELIVDQLTQGTIEDRGAAAERLFNKAAEDETARQKAAAAGVIQPLVCYPRLHASTILHTYLCSTAGTLLPCEAIVLSCKGWCNDLQALRVLFIKQCWQ